jgi:hypothetical protein
MLPSRVVRRTTLDLPKSMSRARTEGRSSRKTAPRHIGDGCFFSRLTDRRSGFLPINPIVILITGRLGLPATLRSRAILGAGQLIRVAVRPARARIIPEPAEALSLRRVGPDHQIPPMTETQEMDVATWQHNRIGLPDNCPRTICLNCQAVGSENLIGKILNEVENARSPCRPRAAGARVSEPLLNAPGPLLRSWCPDRFCSCSSSPLC